MSGWREKEKKSWNLPSAYGVHTTAKHNKRLWWEENACRMYKNDTLAKRAKLLFSIVEYYPSLWRSCPGPGRCLSFQIVVTMVTWDRVRSEDFLYFMFRMFSMTSVCRWLLISVIVLCCISSRFLHERWLLEIQAKDWGDAWQSNNMLALWKKSIHCKCGILTIFAVNYK